MGKNTTTKKSKSSKDSNKEPREPTAWHIFQKAQTETLKNDYPDMKGAERRKEVLRLWKTSKLNPKKET